jgi:GNAT superfamily N-acetyltransferase
MEPRDIEPATAAVLADDFGDRRTWFEFTVRHPACHVVVAERDGDVVGTGVATVNGPVGWIGTVWVASSLRRQGLGRTLTEATIEAATAAGCRTLLLVATRSGRPLYEGLGFEVQTWYRTMEAPGLAGGAAPSRDSVRDYNPSDMPRLRELDRAATGEDRGHLLDAFASPPTCRVVVGDDDRPSGFVVRAPWGGGATIAPDPLDAMAILEARRRAYDPARKIRAGILLENEAGAALLADAGWAEAWRAPRMIRGSPLAWQPSAIWGQYNHALG